MATLQVSAAKKTPLERNLPAALAFDKPYDALTVLDVKKAIAAKNPKVCCDFECWSRYRLTVDA